MKQMAAIDLVVLVVSVAAVLGVGIWYGRRRNTSTEYFLAGRDVGDQQRDARADGGGLRGRGGSNLSNSCSAAGR